MITATSTDGGEILEKGAKRRDADPAPISATRSFSGRDG